MTIIGFIGFFVLLGLVVFQFMLIVGAPLGHFAWSGQHKVLPNKLRIASSFSILLYILFSLFLISKAGIIEIISDSAILSVGMWTFTIYFMLGVVLNFISRSRKERLLMTPIAAILAITFLLVTLDIG